MKLDKIKFQFETELTIKIKLLLLELCKNVKKKTMTEEEDNIFK